MVKGQKAKLTIAARKSRHEGMVYPYSFGCNVFGECANYIAYEVIISYDKSKLVFLYSSATAFSTTCIL